MKYDNLGYILYDSLDKMRDYYLFISFQISPHKFNWAILFDHEHEHWTRKNDVMFIAFVLIQGILRRLSFVCLLVRWVHTRFRYQICFWQKYKNWPLQSFEFRLFGLFILRAISTSNDEFVQTRAFRANKCQTNPKGLNVPFSRFVGWTSLIEIICPFNSVQLCRPTV